MTEKASLAELHAQIIRCRRCPRLVTHREKVALAKAARYREQEYWGKPVPPFGDPDARILVMGLAPAAHGGNRTGRSFTGDPSGDWLFEALYRAGFANQPNSTSLDDGLRLKDVYISNVVRCAPPDNKPNPSEKAACRPYLTGEMELLERVQVVVALGKFAFDAYLQTRAAGGQANPKPRPAFAHSATCRLADGLTLISSYHPSRQNTQTGKLTREMFNEVFTLARERLN